MELGIGTRLTAPFDDTVERTRKALHEQGFGVLTEIDMQATLQAKIGEDIGRYLILGACNPQLAHRAVGVNRQIGLLLPCNVVVREDGGDVVVEAMNPELMVQVSGDPELRSVADDATARLRSAIATLAG
ncbi:DUF302 domain-containing protein [Rhodococcus tukisamuensis]|uniref:Uncharacterized conserved protein, DUF302 family n=1 Tax=Rhodococcus tukisamuensis TaxID=168276 RepID=A0A1G6Y294_9NOCA|nr:DUF302 domain-containing protein [Rhodococcus tukisamuensis]SDD84519.1 Uncharacterized conserved protein, DUF302 family [Rhodococcus tukisamuensis]